MDLHLHYIWKHVETQLFYPRISQRSCHIQNCSCNQNVAKLYSIYKSFKQFFNVILKCKQQFLTWGFRIECWTVLVHDLMDIHWILNWKARWKKSVLYYDIAAILPCTLPFMDPKCSNALCSIYKSFKLLLQRFIVV